MRDLIGTLKMFFDRLGLKKLRFKPAYNPYTEPSMEIFRSPIICCPSELLSDAHNLHGALFCSNGVLLQLASV